MTYYKIKVLSSLPTKQKHRKKSDEQLRKALIDVGVNLTDESIKFSKAQEDYIKKIKRDRCSYLYYSKENGFKLVSKITANTFTKDSLNEPKLKAFLQDKEYELIETNDDYRILRYKEE